MRLLVPQSSCGFSALRVERVASLLWCLRFPSHSLLKSEGSERSGINIPTLSTAPQLSSIRGVASLDLPSSSMRSSVELKREPAPTVPKSAPMYSEGQTLLVRTVVVVLAGYFLLGVSASPRTIPCSRRRGR
jgi:hypothetical protein